MFKILCNSKFVRREEISKLFVTARGLGGMNFSGSLIGVEGSQSLRRASSIRRTFTGTAAMKRKSICLQVKSDLNIIILSEINKI